MLFPGGKPRPVTGQSAASPSESSTSRRPSTLARIRKSLGAEEEIEDSEWRVGGRYKVRSAVLVRAGSELCSEQVGELKPKEVVLLLAVEFQGCVEVGLVVPVRPKTPGWIVLQDPANQITTLVRRRLAGSWEMKARYLVQNPATVRTDASLSSEHLHELSTGDEVLVLDLGLAEGNDGRPRLRALVSVTGTSLIGWISPETSAGDHLLDPVNLLGPEVVKLHRKSLSGGSPTRRGTIRLINGGSTRSSIRGSRVSGVFNSGNGAGGPRRSCMPGSTLPWEVGGQYRILEKLIVRERPDLSSIEIGRVTAGSIATITDIHYAECAYLGWCPCAFIAVEEGPHAGIRGWVRCAAKDGHDLIDTRDQLEFEKIRHRLRSSEQTGASQRRLEATEETSDTGEDSSSSSESREDLPQGAFAEHIESLEKVSDDRVVHDGAMEDQSHACNCNCGGRHTA